MGGSEGTRTVKSMYLYYYRLTAPTWKIANRSFCSYHFGTQDPNTKQQDVQHGGGAVANFIFNSYHFETLPRSSFPCSRGRRYRTRAAMTFRWQFFR